MNAAAIPLGELMVAKKRSIDPRKHPNEEFELFSIPAFDAGEPEIVCGSQIGSSKQVLERHDVLLSRIVPHIRRSWVVEPSCEHRTIGSSEWIVFRSDRFEPNYLRNALTSDRFHRAFMRTVAGVGGSLLRARQSYVAEIEIPLPPIEEQRRIAAVLDAADALRAKRRQALAKLDDLERAVFFDMFGGTLPTHLTVTLGEFMHAKKTSIDPRKSPDEEFELFSIPAFDVGEPEIIHGRDVGSTKQLLEREDVILSRIVPHIRRAGVVTSTSGRRLIGSGEWIIFRGNRFVPRYLRHVLVSDRFHHSFMRTVAGVGGSLLRARPSQVAEIEIPLPPLEEQQMFASHLRAIDDICAKICQSAAWVENLFASLQQRAFRGEL